MNDKIKNGPYEEYYLNKGMRERGIYKAAKKDGVSEHFSAAGKLIEQKWFIDGEEVSETEYLIQKEKSKTKYRIEMRSKIMEYREATRALLLELQTATSERKEQAQKLMALRKKYGHKAKEHIKEIFLAQSLQEKVKSDG